MGQDDSRQEAKIRSPEKENREKSRTETGKRGAILIISSPNPPTTVHQLVA
jgi:hypothetical protein